jgi:hypothetical protein
MFRPARMICVTGPEAAWAPSAIWISRDCRNSWEGRLCFVTNLSSINAYALHPLSTRTRIGIFCFLVSSTQDSVRHRPLIWLSLTTGYRTAMAEMRSGSSFGPWTRLCSGTCHFPTPTPSGGNGSQWLLGVEMVLCSDEGM